MSFMRRSILASALMVVAPLAATAQPLAVPQHVPENPLVVVSFGDVNAFWNAYSKTSLKTHIDQLMAMPEIAGEGDFQQMQEEIDKASAELGLSLAPADFFGKTLKGFDLYVLPATEATKASGEDVPGMVVTMKLDSPESATKLATWITNKASEVEPPYEWVDPTAEATPTPAPTPTPLAATTSEVAGFKVTTVEAGDGDLPFNIAQKGDTLLLSNDADLLNGTITSPGATRLSEAPEFQSVYAPLANMGGQMLFYVSPTAMKEFAAAGGTADPEALGQQPPVAAVARIKGTSLDIASRTMVPPDGDPSIARLMAIAPGPVASMVRLASPKSLISMGANMLEGEQIYDYGVRQAEQANPEGGAELAEQLAAVDEALGMSLRDDALAAFGPAGSFHLNEIRYGGGFDIELDTLVSLQVRDEEKAQMVMSTLKAAILDSLNAQVEEGAPAIEEATMAHGGVDISMIPIMAQPLPVPVQPGFYTARAGDTQLIALTEAGIKAAIDRANGSAPGGADLVARAAKAGNDTTSANSFSWVDFGAFASTFREALPTIVGMSGGDAAMQTQMELIANIVDDLGTVSATQTNDPEGQSSRVVWALK